MNYWERWIGDWKRKTAHLSCEERGVYADLLDHAYATEAPLPGSVDALCRIVGAQTPTERKAVQRVADEFFTTTDSGLVNKRVQEEIEKRHAFIAQQRENISKRWRHEREPPPPRGNGEDKPSDPARRALRETAKRVLAFLNEKSGKKFREVEANLKPILARLAEFDETMLRSIILHRCQLWSADEKMAEFLRPATLFNATKCAQYPGELEH